MSEATTTLQFSPTAVKMVENKAAVTVGTTALSKKENENGICEAEARVRAFMRMLRVKEGTEGEKGYKTLFTHAQFSDMSKHPQEVITAGKYSSSAAGAYQIMTDTWKNLTGYYLDSNKKWYYSEKSDYTKKYNITSFDQESQDKFCLVIMKHNYFKDRIDSFYNPVFWKDDAKTQHDTERETKVKEWRKRFKGQQGDIIQFVIDNDIKRASLLASLAWASLPDSPYGQQSSSYTFENVKTIYEGFLKEELISPSKELYLKKGFLKEFNYSCCGENTTTKVEGKGWNIDIHLWSERKTMGYGILILKNDNKEEVWRTIVRGQGYNNQQGGDRKEKFADTPTGVYKFEKWRNDGSSTIYGSNNRLDMTYESGEAKDAGREEIQIHGGRQADDKNPYLWNTGGCLRVFDDAIVTLKKKIDALESKSSKKKNHYINVLNTLKYDSTSKKYF